MEEARKMDLWNLVKQIKNLPQDDAHEIWCIPFDKYGFHLEAKPKNYFALKNGYNPLAIDRYYEDFVIPAAITQLPMAQQIVDWERRHRTVKALHTLQCLYPRSVMCVSTWQKTETAIGTRYRAEIRVYGHGKE